MATKNEVKVPKSIVITWEGSDYTLEYDRDAVTRIERGYNVTMGDLQRGSIVAFQYLFFGGFFKHHPNIKQTTLDQIYDSIPDKMALFKVLSEMYAESVNSLIDEPVEGKASTWKVV